MGQIKLELIQPVEGESIPKQFLDSRGEGVLDICSYVDNLDKAVAKLVEFVDEWRTWPISERSDQHAQPVQAGIRW